MKKFLVFTFMFYGVISLHASTNVTVSITPQKYFVEKIAKDKVNINIMVKPGFSPATYEPQTSQMKQLSSSKVYFSIGVPFEHSWLSKFENANKNMKIVDTTMGIEKIQMAAHEHEDEHEDEDEDEKEHNSELIDEDGLDPHVWLDPILVKIQAKNIYETLANIDSENKEFYFKNYTLFLKELDMLNNKIKTILKPVNQGSFMVFHPSWGYFAKRYNLEQIAVEKEGKEPKPRELVELIKDSKKHNIKVVFISPQFSKKAANTIAKSIKGKTFTIDHLSYDYEINLINTANAIYNSYK